MEQQDILDLYEEFYLLDEPTVPAVKENEKKPKELRFQGGNQKRILFIYHDKNQPDKRDTEMLNNLIVNAIKISWDDVAVLNLFENETPSVQEIAEILKPAKVIVWGCDDYLQANNIAAGKYELKDTGSFQLILADNISAYHDNKDLKVNLWNAIRTLLQI